MRFTPGQRKNSSTGAWRRQSEVTSDRAERETYRGWQIEISHRQVGLTIRRNQYSALIQSDAYLFKQSLSGFSTREAALAAARRQIDERVNRQRARDRQPRRSKRT